MKKKLFHNRNGQAFKEISAQAGVDNDRYGRGIALGDFDTDGQLDLFQTNADQPALIYRGVSEGAGCWVQFRLTGTKSNRDAIGARIRVTAGGLTQIRRIDGSNGYASQSMRRAHFGIGKAAKVEAMEVLWPSGRKEAIGPIAVNAVSHVVEGRGIVP
jgi:hypothetical protein